MPLAPEVVDALYRALLGRAADPDGAARWAQADSVEQVVAGFATSDEFAGRLESLIAMSAGQSAAAGTDPAVALAAGQGHVALGAPQWTSGAVLTAFPWSEVSLANGPGSARVLGPYARVLASELEARALARTSTAGLPDPAGDHRHDLLILTDPAYLEALATARPDVFAATRRRVLCPTPPLPTDPHERGAVRNRARRALHAAGFVEVAVVVRRRHGGEAQVLGVTHLTPDPGVLLPVREERPDREGRQAWFVADRSPGLAR